MTTIVVGGALMTRLIFEFGVDESIGQELQVRASQLFEHIVQFGSLPQQLINRLLCDATRHVVSTVGDGDFTSVLYLFMLMFMLMFVLFVLLRFEVSFCSDPESNLLIDWQLGILFVVVFHFVAVLIIVLVCVVVIDVMMVMMVGAFSFEINVLAQVVEYPWWCMEVSVHCCVYELLSVFGVCFLFLFFGVGSSSVLWNEKFYCIQTVKLRGGGGRG